MRRLRNLAVSWVVRLALVALLFPVLWGVIVSFKTRVDALSMPPRWIFTPTVANYRGAFSEGDAGRTLLNSFVIASGSAVLTVIFALPVAYWVSRRSSRRRQTVLVATMTTRLAPATVIALPLFLAFARLNLLDTYIPIILVHAGVMLAPAIWLLSIAFDRVPTAIDDASYLDGDTTITFMMRQLLAIVRAAVAIVLGFCFVMSWNEFFLAVMLTGYSTRPFTVVVAGLVTPHGTNWGRVMAICTVAMVPGAVLAFLSTRYLAHVVPIGARRDGE